MSTVTTPVTNLDNGQAKEKPVTNEMIADWLRIFILPGQVTELRFLGVVDDPKYPPCTVSGFFDHDHLVVSWDY